MNCRVTANSSGTASHKCFMFHFFMQNPGQPSNRYLCGAHQAVRALMTAVLLPYPNFLRNTICVHSRNGHLLQVGRERCIQVDNFKIKHIITIIIIKLFVKTISCAFQNYNLFVFVVYNVPDPITYP